MADVEIIEGDALASMATLRPDSIDMILTDPPYFRTSKEAWDRQWKTEVDYLAWLGLVADEWRRVLKPNGSLYCFASPRMAARVECLIAERFNVVNAITWQKDFPCGALKYGAENFRGYVEMSERIVFAEHRGSDGFASEASGGADSFDGGRRKTFGAYLESEIARSGATRKEVAALFPSKTGGVTGCVSNWVLGLNTPTLDQYQRIREFLNTRTVGGAASGYESIQQEYESLRRPFFLTPDVPYTDVWTYKPVSQARLLHPCQKPLPLLMHVLNTSSREGDVILDNFAGSGSTLVACQKAGRRAIGIEIDPRYIPLIRRRVREAETPLFQSIPPEGPLP